jgi:3-hydroxybutyryl-CoA dehydrogenase
VTIENKQYHMKEKIEDKKNPILVVGDRKLAYNITVCLLHAGHPVTLFTDNKMAALKCINAHFDDMYKQEYNVFADNKFNIIDSLGYEENCKIAIVVTNEDLSRKKAIIRKIEHILDNQALIAINTESIPLSAIQQNARHPERIIGANWAEPVHTTYFLEIISNEKTQKDLVSDFYSTARKYWKKDPYILKKDNGIRARMMSAMVREAFYLVEKGYVSIEDIDRSCRNDAGYYLPFAGNCRYMDLMGTYIYGIVMKDLNSELAKGSHIPGFFTKIIEQGGKGMENSKGFYVYQDGDVEKLNNSFRKFSYQIQRIIGKYLFNYKEESSKSKIKEKATTNS